MTAVSPTGESSSGDSGTPETEDRKKTIAVSSLA